MTDTSEVTFTNGEKPAILATVITPYERFRRSLIALLNARKAHQRDAKGALARYCQHTSGWLSNLIRADHRSENPRLDVDDLTNIAAFFRVSVDELLTGVSAKDLHHDERRLIVAFRALPQSVRDYVLGVTESASLGAHLAKRLEPRATSAQFGKEVILQPTEKPPRLAAGSSPEVVDDHRVPHAAEELQQLRTRLNGIVDELSDLALGGKERGRLPNTGENQP